MGLVYEPGGLMHRCVTAHSSGELQFLDFRMIGDSDNSAGILKTVQAHSRENLTAVAGHPHAPLIATGTASQVSQSFIWSNFHAILLSNTVIQSLQKQFSLFTFQRLPFSQHLTVLEFKELPGINNQICNPSSQMTINSQDAALPCLRFSNRVWPADLSEFCLKLFDAPFSNTLLIWQAEVVKILNISIYHRWSNCGVPQENRGQL